MVGECLHCGGGGVQYFIVLLFCEVFSDYGGMYCCDVGVYVLFCNGIGWY